MTKDLSYPLHWPAGWPRARGRSEAKFGQKDYSKSYQTTKRVTIATAMERLDAELTRLGARGIILSSNLERTLSGAPRSGQADPADPGVAVYFTLKGKDTVLACDRWYRAADNMVAIAKHIEAIRGMDRWGVGSIDQAFAGYQALPAPEQWFQVLGVASSATKATVDDAFKRLAHEAHPDKPNGSTAKMQRLNDARSRAYQENGW